MTKKTVEDVSSFIEMVKNLNTGATRDELDDAVKDSLMAINDFGGQAVITLKVTLKKDKGFKDVVKLTDNVTVNLPKEDRAPSMMFSTTDSRLVMQRQDQEEMKLTPSVYEAENVTPLKESK